MKRNLMTLSASLLLAVLFLSGGAAAQTCNKSIVATTPDASFTIHKDGTVTHKSTGLMWMRCSLGQSWDGNTCRGTAGSYSWGAALQAADSHAFAGYTDWRLPNKNELETILEERCNSPAINERIFPTTPQAHFWSSSPYAGQTSGAWSMGFDYGAVNASVKSGIIHVRLVRGGP
jgi:hypothetical protein